MVCESFSKLLREDYGYRAYAPYSGACFDLLTGQMLAEGVKIPAAHKDYAKAKAQSEGGRRAIYLAEQLDLAGSRLLRIISQSKGGANRDMEKLLNQINELCGRLEKS